MNAGKNMQGVRELRPEAAARHKVVFTQQMKYFSWLVRFKWLGCTWRFGHWLWARIVDWVCDLKVDLIRGAEVPMKDVYEVIRQKERDVQRVENEIAALQSAIPLLEEDEDVLELEPAKPRSSWLKGPGQEHHVSHEN
jgi:hypothetical protein